MVCIWQCHKNCRPRSILPGNRANTHAICFFMFPDSTNLVPVIVLGFFNKGQQYSNLPLQL